MRQPPLRAWTSRKNRRGMRGRRREERRRGGAGGGRRMSAPPVHESWIRHCAGAAAAPIPLTGKGRPKGRRRRSLPPRRAPGRAPSPAPVPSVSRRRSPAHSTTSPRDRPPGADPPRAGCAVVVPEARPPSVAPASPPPRACAGTRQDRPAAGATTPRRASYLCPTITGSEVSSLHCHPLPFCLFERSNLSNVA